MAAFAPTEKISKKFKGFHSLTRPYQRVATESINNKQRE